MKEEDEEEEDDGKDNDMKIGEIWQIQQKLEG